MSKHDSKDIYIVSTFKNCFTYATVQKLVVRCFVFLFTFNFYLARMH